MEIVWIVISGFLILLGIIGCVVPLLPGPPVSYVGLLILQLREEAPFTTKFLIIWAVIVVAISLIDYLVPLYGTKRFGGTRYGVWGCAVGLIIGFWFGPVGIFAGPFLGAFVGEWLGNQTAEKALKAALGSFVGFLFGTVIKLIASVMMLYYFVLSII